MKTLATILMVFMFVINTPLGYLRWTGPGKWELVTNPRWATSFGSHAEANANAQTAGLRPGSFWIERTGQPRFRRFPWRWRRR